MDKIKPNTNDNMAAPMIRYSSGSRKTRVCAGIQKNGIVFSMTNEMKVSQWIFCDTAFTVIVPPIALCSMQAADTSWNNMNVGEKRAFMLTEVTKAKRNLFPAMSMAPVANK
ncbi:MAG: hypothetical protein HFE75_11070 [Firmicutes bacterium]|nr:hypothetical protein [Bacillota bacterium]